jgi:hypothetical protein
LEQITGQPHQGIHRQTNMNTAVDIKVE